MNKSSKIAVVSLALFTAVSTAWAAEKTEAPKKEKTLSVQVGDALGGLSWYGVFDLLQYQVLDDGAVELSGFVYRDALKKEAEQAVSKVPGVKQVVNKIEDLPWGVADDEIRAKVYLTLYRDSQLSRYGTATDMALANRVGYGSRSIFGPMGIGNPFFPGFNPTGGYGIHILVTNGEVILAGDVDSRMDKILAELKTRGVFPVKKVFNELTIKGKHPEVPEPQVRPTRRGVVAVAE
jgi:hypothetical protein